MHSPPGLLLALAAASVTVALPAHADEAALAARVEQMQAELDNLKAELHQLKAQGSATTAGDSGTRTALPPAAASAAPVAATPPDAPATTLFGYGEINYANYPKNKSQTQADLARAVIGIGHRFDERTRFVGEFEWEHAVTSAGDQGEAAVEQFYVERSLTPQLAARAGLFLIPSGMLNVSHEPTQYFGVTRDFVDQSIIPTTWREGGIGLTGLTSFDLSWDLGITTGFNLANWDPTSNDGKYSPLGSIHQELQFANAANLSAYGALNWRGVPGLLLGGSVFGGKAGQKQPDFPSQKAVVTLAEAHARWTPGPFDLSAQYAYGHISDTAAYNLTIVGNPTLVPQAFFGAYVQAAWHAWRHDDYQLAPFVRYERINTGWKYAALADGLTPSALPTEGVATLGASFFVTPNIVLKADYQWFQVDNSNNRFELGLGLNF